MTHPTQKDQLRALLNGNADEAYRQIYGGLPAVSDGVRGLLHLGQFRAGFQARDPLISELIEVVRVQQEALKLAVKRVDYLADMHMNESHAIANTEYFRPVFDEALTRAQPLLDLMEKNNG